MALRQLAVAVVLFLASTSLAAPKQRLVILNLTASDKSIQSLAESTSELISTELSRSKRFEIISQSDVATMLGVERQRQLLGCAKDGASCLAELSSAFGSKWLVTGSLARLGKKLRLDLKVINTDTNSTPFRDGKTFKDQEDLFDGASAMVRELVGRDDLWGAYKPEVKVAPPEPQPTPAPVVVTAPEPAPTVAASTPVGPWVVTGIGGAAFLTGAVFTVLAASEYASLSDPNFASGHVWTVVKSTTDDFNRNIILGSVLLGAGAAIAVAGIVWRAVSDSKPPPVALTFTTAGVLVAGTF